MINGVFLLQSNELYQNISAQVKQFGENVKAQGQKVIEKVQGSGASSQMENKELNYAFVNENLI